MFAAADINICVIYWRFAGFMKLNWKTYGRRSRCAGFGLLSAAGRGETIDAEHEVARVKSVVCRLLAPRVRLPRRHTLACPKIILLGHLHVIQNGRRAYSRRKNLSPLTPFHAITIKGPKLTQPLQSSSQPISTLRYKSASHKYLTIITWKERDKKVLLFSFIATDKRKMEYLY